MIKKIAIGLTALVVVIQFFRIDKTNPVIVQENDFITITNPPENIQHLLKSACYDCHSNESKYPWYTNIAPISWWVKDHINEGRDELNFSEWGTYKEKRQKHKLKETIEVLEEGEMPLESYLIIHDEAKMTIEQKNEFIDWMKMERAK